MVGQTLSHYRILERLGKGGMGEVYLAEDHLLKRRVALKILPPEMASDPSRLERFQREAEALAALDHPNIVTIYSVEEAAGYHFLTMGLVAGAPLDRTIAQAPPDLEGFFEIAIPLAAAIAAAHEQGIVHRDLKPANVMLSGDRPPRVKVLDFGLAKLEDPAFGAADELPTQALTEAGLVVGTVPYMSPEQLQGKPVDHRTDIFSLGVLLYQLATGRLPFRGETPADLVSAILRDDPPPVTELNAALPYHLGRIVKRCLEKSRKDRFQSARDLYNELRGLKREVDSGEIGSESSTGVAVAARSAKTWRWIAAAAVIAAALVAGLFLRQAMPVASAPPAAASLERKMLVVLPFENRGSPDDGYFAVGVSEEITSRLAAVRGLGVISRGTAASYDRAGKSLRQIADDLGVDYVLDGTVRWAKAGDGASRVRITPQLVRAADDSQLWSETYDRVIDDIFAVQSDIAEKVVRELDVSLLGSERQALEAKPTDDLEAYQAYLQGMAYFLQYGFENQLRAIERFERAAELDPEFVLAHAKIAQRSTWAHFQGDVSEDWLAKAEAALERALALAPGHPAVRLAEGYYHYYGFGRYQRALEAFEAAAEAWPNDAEAIAAIAFIHRRQGKMEAALEGLSRAAELDPRNVELIWDLAATYRALRRFAEADRVYDQGITLAPENDFFYVLKAQNLVAWTGSTERARTVLASIPRGERPELAAAWQDLDLFDRDFEKCLARLAAAPADILGVSYQLGLIHSVTNRPELARPPLEAARNQFEEALRTGPELAQLRQYLARTYALLGRREEAVREAEQAIELNEKDAWTGPKSSATLAFVHAWTGAPERAVELLEHLLSIPYEQGLTVHELGLDPAWDPLRGEPRFRELLARYGASA